MQFKRKVLALKETECGFAVNGKKLSGVCRLECEKNSGELFLTLINGCEKSDFSYGILLFDAKNKAFWLDLPTLLRPTKQCLPQDFCFDGGVAVGIYAVKDNTHKTILFAKEESCKLSFSLFNKTVSEKLIACKPKQESVCKDLETTKNQAVPTVTPTQDFSPAENQDALKAYDDEAVATENYFELDEQINQKLNTVKEWTLEKVRIEDGEPYIASTQEKTQVGNYFDFAQNETDFVESGKSENGQPFFLTVRDELDELFKKFPKEDSLEKTFLNSRWAKVYYSKEKYYVVGLVKEDGKEKYICYGVPAVYSKNPPKELDGYCTFIPLSVFDLNGDGFWMMFQSSITGECLSEK